MFSYLILAIDYKTINPIENISHYISFIYVYLFLPIYFLYNSGDI